MNFVKAYMPVSHQKLLFFFLANTKHVDLVIGPHDYVPQESMGLLALCDIMLTLYQHLLSIIEIGSYNLSLITSCFRNFLFVSLFPKKMLFMRLCEHELRTSLLNRSIWDLIITSFPLHEFERFSTEVRSYNYSFMIKDSNGTDILGTHLLSNKANFG